MSEPELLSQIAKEVSATNARLAALDVHIKGIVGPPSLEDRLILRMDGRDDHIRRNQEEALRQSQTIMAQDLKISKLELEKQIIETRNIAISNNAQLAEVEETRKRDHAANGKKQEATDKKVDKLSKIQNAAYVVLVAAQAYIVYVVQGKH